MASEFSRPILWLGYVWFFGLGCFSVAAGMGGVEFLIASLCSAMLEWMGRGWESMLSVYFENCIGYYIRVILGAFVILNLSASLRGVKSL